MSADIIDFGSRAELPTAISTLDNMARAINSTREMLSIFEPKDRFEILSSVLASEACDYADRNACHGNAIRVAGECFAVAVMGINKTFPPPGEEPFR